MGAVFNFERLVAKTAAEAIDEGQEIIKQAEWDYGHAGYTGSFAECNGVRVDEGYVADDEEDAEQWLEENAEKWGPMLIVAAKDGSYYAGAWCSS